MKELIGVQYLRGFAALAVVVFHALLVINPQGDHILSIAMFSAGVDVFFVISGFIIWRTTEKPGLQPGRWWVDRIIRIAPLYWVALALLLAIRYAREDFSTEALPPLIEVIRCFLFVSGERDPFFMPGWTLQYEFFFYATLGLALFLRRPALRLFVLTVVFAALLAMKPLLGRISPELVRYGSPLILEFIAGIYIAVLSQRLHYPKLRQLLGFIALGAAAACAILLTPKLFATGARSTFYSVPAAFLVLAAVLIEDTLRRAPMRALKALGDISYSLYLSHVFALMATSWIFGQIFGESKPAALFVLAVSATSVGLAILVYRWIEKPMLTGLRSLLNGARPPAPATPSAAITH